MAAIDSLLRLIASQKADALRLRPGAAPVLLVGEGERPLSMPALPAEMVDSFLEELSPGSSTLARDGALELPHVTASGDPFRVSVELMQGRVVRATFRPGRAAPAPLAPDEAVAPALSGRAKATPRPEVKQGVGRPDAGSSRTPVREREGPGEVPSARSASGSARTRAAALAAPTAQTALTRLLAEAVTREVSDIFLSTGRPARWRIQGVLSSASSGPAEVVPLEGDIEALLGDQLTESARARLSEHGSVDLAFELAASGEEPPPRFRVSLFWEEAGLVAAFRLIRSRAPGLEELGLPDAVARLADHRHGLVLMVGPTGSGKSTTLAGLIEQLNRSVARHVITIEDPIELRYQPERCLIHQREVGTHVSGFADGIRSALRSSPDVILVGEMRDPETIATALTAAETGHLVLSTLHCGSAGMAVDRIVDGFPQARQNQVRCQLADVLRSVVSQRLLPGVGGGLVPAVEILHANRAVAALIRDGRTHQIQTVIQTGREAGMVSLERSLAELVRSGRISAAVAMEAADSVPELQALLGR